MKCLKLFVLLAAAVATPLALAQGDPEAGEEKAQVCAACHGPDGNSPSDQYPSLAGQGVPYAVKQLQEFKSGDRENAIMQGQAAGLSEQDMQNLAAFYAKQNIEIGQAKQDLVEKGERLYRGGDVDKGIPACAGCHGPAGQGIEAAAFPALAGQHPAYTESQLKAFRAEGREDIGDMDKRANDPQGMMRDLTAKMSDAQIQAVSNFVAGLSAVERDSE